MLVSGNNFDAAQRFNTSQMPYFFLLNMTFFNDYKYQNVYPVLYSLHAMLKVLIM